MLLTKYIHVTFTGAEESAFHLSITTIQAYIKCYHIFQCFVYHNEGMNATTISQIHHTLTFLHVHALTLKKK